MAGERTVRGEPDAKRPVSVKDTTVPKIKKIGGDLGAVLCEGLVQIERSSAEMVEALRRDLSDTVAGVADDTTSQVRSLRATAAAAQGAANSVREQFSDKANRSDVEALGERLQEAESSLGRVSSELEGSLGAMTRTVEVPNASGDMETKVLRGKELMDHAFAELQTCKDALGALDEQLSQVGPTRTSQTTLPSASDDNELNSVKQAIQSANTKMKKIIDGVQALKASVRETFVKVDDKIEFIANLMAEQVLGPDYQGDNALKDAYGEDMAGIITEPVLKKEE
jgi:hypothetical protein